MTKNSVKLSSKYKIQAVIAIFSVGLFVLTYIFILLFAIGLTALCVYGGIMLIKAFPSFFTIVVGTGLASFGVLILVFLLKFVFKSHRIDHSNLYEIEKNEEPEIFNLIDEIVKKVGTKFPKKVYLSTNVNAAVFYDSGFWSMFFPTRKNLQIGLGLVNSVTKSELKAILSHEFGHFSQKTMTVGSYVYNVNHVIFNLLYENDSYDKFIQHWAGVSSYFLFFVGISIKIIKGIQWVLRKQYDVVNMSYMGLSREMEFHADEIAANIVGFEPLRDSLLRMTLAEHSLNNVFEFYDKRIADNFKSKNIYKEQYFVMIFLAMENNIPIVNGFPAITVEDLNRFNKSKLVIKDQWASHPDIEERIARMGQFKNALEKTAKASANEIFQNIEKIQEKLTNLVFEEVEYLGEASYIPLEKFQSEFKKEYYESTFSKFYNGYYDSKNPVPFDTSIAYPMDEDIKIEELFSDDKVDLINVSISLQNDMEILRNIDNKAISAKTFDYNGKRYKRKKSKELLSKLDLELKQVNEQIKQNDIRIYKFFKKREQSQNKKSKLRNLYRELFEFDIEFDDKHEIYLKLLGELQLLNSNLPLEQIRVNIQQIEILEPKFKSVVKELLEDINYLPEITKSAKDNFELYLSKRWIYFGYDKYYEDNLRILFTAMNDYALLLSRRYFLLKKKLLDYQEELIKNDI